MTDKELFLKYNFINTNEYTKNEELNFQLYNNLILNQKKQKQNQWIIIIHGSDACNANCIYCENHVLRDEYNNAIITPEIIINVVNKLGKNIRELTWHGGEALLLPEEYFILLENEKQKNNLHFTTTLQTNGILLTKEKQEFFHNLNIGIGYSFDGIYNTTNRGIASTKAILRLIHEVNDFASIAVYTKDSITSLIDNYEYIKQVGIKNFQSCIVRENVIEADNKYLIKNDIALQNLIEYFKYWIHDTSAPITDAYLKEQILRLLGSSTVCEHLNCLRGWLIIDPLGNITTCGMFGVEENFGNVLQINDFFDVLTNPKYINYFQKAEQLIDRECHNCEWKTACYGGCLGLNYEQDHTLQTINERSCDYNKRLLNEIYEIIKDIDINSKEYNPIFIDILKENNYYSLTEIKQIEKEQLKNA